MNALMKELREDRKLRMTLAAILAAAIAAAVLMITISSVLPTQTMLLASTFKRTVFRLD